MIEGKGISDQIIGQSVIGGDEFIPKIKEAYLSKESDGEAPAHKIIRQYGAKDEIIAITTQSGKPIETIKAEKGLMRQILMDLLYRQGGMTNPEIGKIFGIDYTAVSQERRRLRILVEKDRGAPLLLQGFESQLSQVEK